MPANPVFRCTQLPRDVPASVGKTEDWLFVLADPWTIALRITKDARFPKTDDLIRDRHSAPSSLQFDPADAKFLVKALPKLPGSDDPMQSVTVELNSHVTIRARADGQSPVTELVLANSRADGERIVLTTNR
ncbi:MAG TPA: hypothetical protein VG713_00260 [Pirellulales bacterium]|nr:hypothetical protein [Pirellulales bacterium]